MSEQSTPINGAADVIPEASKEQCSFCSFSFSRDNPSGFRPIAKGKSLDSILRSAANCPSCSRQNALLHPRESELHNLAQGKRLDIQIMRNPHEKCLRTCLDSHTKCREGTTPGWLPTRLIDVGVKGSPAAPKLVFSAGIPQDADRRYIALNHHFQPMGQHTRPWARLIFEREGSITRNVALHTGNLASFADAIPHRRLHQTHQTAMSVARRSGVRFLWINTLCIVQNSAADHDLECATLDMIYGNSLLTLAVPEGGYGRRGFFDWPNPVTTASVRCLGNQGVFLDDTGSVARRAPYRVAIGIDRWREMGQEALATEEHLLAPRTIHFGQRMTWECRETVAKQLFDGLCVFPSDHKPKIWDGGLGPENRENSAENAVSSVDTAWIIIDRDYKGN
ncbi:Uu.00g144140.m01.CDS01 [Anthostomella pinea]|uniref:Uu.00g144140.m01.CDS01 n=1 Tax=Anthostomella pinea TaxID=933095 RepID=A0AAI8VRP5_9PEZI|nr:Uu.00g144140.m01.CDS01 [Anthostomella pinea]